MKREICRKKLKAFVGGAGICHAANKLILLAFLLTCHALIGASAASTTCSPVSPIGANKFDLLNQYLGIASGGDGGVRYRDVTRAMALKALDDASDAGISLMRVAVSGFAPSAHGARSDLDLWHTEPSMFWATVDSMMDDLDNRGIRIVPVLMFNQAQFPSMTGETVSDLVRDRGSAAWQLLVSFTTDFVTRYRGRSTILFYELTNELNLLADLDNVRRCKVAKRGKLCDVVGNFSTDELIAFIERFARVVRGADNSSRISSGFSVPRAGAEHLRARPEFGPGGPDWTRDTSEQFAKYLSETHRALDIISIHVYDNAESRRFGSSDPLDLVSVAKRLTDRANKPLFVGEFGERAPRKAKAGSFVDRMIIRLGELHVQYSAVWVWEFYQFKTYLTYDGPATFPSLEPGYTDFLIGKIRAANVAASRSTPQVGERDTSPPRVVLTWPLECELVMKDQLVHAVASDDRGKVDYVEFLVDGRTIARASSPPYQVHLHGTELPDGDHLIVAKAVDPAGNAANWVTRLVVGRGRKDDGACSSAAVH